MCDLNFYMLENISGEEVISAHPHPPIAYGWPVFGQSQNEQIHLILTASTDTETKTFQAFFQLYCKEVKILHTRIHKHRGFKYFKTISRHTVKYSINCTGCTVSTKKTFVVH